MATEQDTRDEAIKKADAMAWQGRWEEALTCYRQAMTKSPDDVLCHSSIGLALTRLGRVEEALRAYQKVSEALPKDLLIRARIADCYAKLGRMVDCTNAFLALGDEYARQKDYGRAASTWRKLASLVPGQEDAMTRLAEALEREGNLAESAAHYAALAVNVGKRDYGRAEQLARKALQLDPGNAEARGFLGIGRQRDGSHGHAGGASHSRTLAGNTGTDDRPTLTDGAPGAQAIPFEPATPQQVAEVGIALTITEFTPMEPERLPEGMAKAVDSAIELSGELAGQGLYLAALDECFQAMRLAPTHLPLQLQLSEIQAARGRFDEAVEKLSLMAEVYMVRGDVEGAVSMHRRISELCPDDLDGRSDFVRLLLQTGKSEEALEQQMRLAESRATARQFGRAASEFKEAIRMAPGRVEPHLRFGCMLMDMGRTGDGMREFEEAAEIDPDHPEVMLRLSIANRLSGDHEEAQKQATQLIESVKGNVEEAEKASREYLLAADEHPDVPDFFAWAGLLLCALKPAEAILHLERAAERAFDAEAVRIGLCKCYLSQGMLAEALALLGKLTVRRSAEFRPLLLQQSERLAGEGRWSEAIALLETLRKWDPQDEGVFVKLAEIYFKRGDVPNAVREFDSLGQFHLARQDSKKAIAIFQVVKQISPKTPLPYLRLASVFASEGMTKQAISEYETLADMQMKQGQVQQGIASLKRVVELEPNRAKSYIALGEALVGIGDHVEASLVFGRLLELDPTNGLARSRLAEIRGASGS